MSNMKCPICNDGKIIAYLDGTYECDNPECSIYNGTHTETFEALIRTRKALEILLFTINRLENQNYKDCAWHLRLAIAKIEAIDIANKTQEQITALEQKDVK